MKQFVGNPSRSQLPTIDPELSAASNLLLNAVHTANRIVYETAKKKAAYRGMGATVSAVYIPGDTLIVANVGDSPVYLVRASNISTLSVPHTMIAEYRGLKTTGAKALGEDFRHVITRAMGVKPTVAPDASEHRLHGNERIVICSDGLSDLVEPKDIAAMATGDVPAVAVKKMVERANAGGGKDNITAVVLSVSAPPTATVTGSGASTALSAVAVDYDTDEVSHHAYTDTISPDGMFIQTSEPVGVGKVIQVTINAPQRMPLSVSATVKQRNARGITVAFNHLKPGQRAYLADLERRLKATP
jgi:serine/threonine protein phosphatase PrpC